MLRSRALLLRAVSVGESDLIVTLFTEQEGKLGASFRSGRKSARRAAGGVEPFHTVEVLLEDKGGELMALRESQFVAVRSRLTASLEAMESAGEVLRWARHLLPVRHADPEAWDALVRLLDGLEAEPSGAGPLAAVAGLRLLACSGYALDLSRCVVCGRPCPRVAPASVDARRGGLVCTRCGAGPRRLEAETRRLAADAQRGGDGADAAWAGATAMPPAQAGELRGLVSEAMRIHADLDAKK